MTLKNLRSLDRVIESYQQLDINEVSQLSSLKGLQFYSDWSPSQKIVTDFNHAIGLPQKNGVAYPPFDYEQMLYEALQSNKHIWIKKATGLGITEFMLRYMAWLCLRDDRLRGSQMCIVYHYRT